MQVLALMHRQEDPWYPQRLRGQDTGEFLQFCCDVEIPSDSDQNEDTADNPWGLKEHEDQIMAARCQIYFDIFTQMGLTILGLGNYTPQ
jgi:hypothetical protein